MGANTGETSFHSADHMQCHRKTLGHLISSVLAASNSHDRPTPHPTAAFRRPKSDWAPAGCGLTGLSPVPHICGGGSVYSARLY